jgi:aspartate racemase
VGGDVFVFLELAALLGPDQPTYGIQAVGLDGKSARPVSVEDLAANYVKEIISFQPAGPVHLAGFSMGGLIAFEIAQQLQRLGRRVAVLALFDTLPIGKTPWVFFGLAMATYVSQRSLLHLGRLWKSPRGERLGYLRGPWATFRETICQNWKEPPPMTQLQSARPPFRGEDYYVLLASAYQLRPYLGSADVFVSDQNVLGWRLYWRYLARGGVSFHRIPGVHAEILSPPYVSVLAQALTKVLQRAHKHEHASPSAGGHTDANLISR